MNYIIDIIICIVLCIICGVCPLLGVLLIAIVFGLHIV